MLSSTTVLAVDGVQLADVACRHGIGRGHELEPASGLALVFIRRGCFVRAVEGEEHTLDATLAYAMNPGEEQRFDHPHEGGDDCTVLSMDQALVASLWGGEGRLPSGPIPVDPMLDIQQRLLLAQAAGGEDPHASYEQSIRLAAALLEASDERRVANGSPRAVSRRRILVDEARQALVDDPNLSLARIARSLSVSPHHLSRIFHATTGQTIARHRMRIRVRDVLQRLAGGELDLARLAIDAGFSDQSHLCRVVRSETGTTPGALRHALRVA